MNSSHRVAVHASVPSKHTEGPVYDERIQVLYIVDILGKFVIEIGPTGEENTRHAFEDYTTAVALTDDPEIIVVACGLTVLLFNRTTGTMRPIARVPDSSALRLNECKVGPDGRLYAGTMHIETRLRIASLYAISRDGSCIKLRNNLIISNGLAWSLDGTKMYHIDSLAQDGRGIDVYDFTAGCTSLQLVRRIVEPFREILPKVDGEVAVLDGMDIDAEGMLWVAGYGTGKIWRINPVTCAVLAEISFSPPKVTSCFFGMNDGANVLFVTTTKEHMSDADLNRFPKSGSVYRVPMAFGGGPRYRFH